MGCIVLVLGVGRCAFRPPRVVFVLGLVSLINSLTSGKKFSRLLRKGLSTPLFCACAAAGAGACSRRSSTTRARGHGSARPPPRSLRTLHCLARMDHTPACASRPEEEWGRLLVEQYEGAPLGVVPLYGGEVWNAAGSRMRLRHIPRCRPGRRQRGMVQQLTNVDVYCNGERLGAPSCQALVWHGDTITFGAAFPRATLVTHVVEINPLFLQLSLTKRRQRPRALPMRAVSCQL